MTDATHAPSAAPSATSTALAPDIAAARGRLAGRRGVTGRWYRAEAVDELLDAVSARLAAVMAELERMRRINHRLAEIDHRRRFGTLPAGMRADSATEEEVQRRIDEQETIDRMLDDASEQAAAIISEARDHYLRTIGLNGTPPVMERDDAARAERAEAHLREVTALLERWATFLVDRDAAEWRIANDRSAELRAAYNATVSVLTNIGARQG